MKKTPKQETEQEKLKRLERNRKARARRWLKTGVSEYTVRWMSRSGML